MVVKKIAPYGAWESNISIEDATAGSKALSSPRGDIHTGRAFFLQSTPSGASTILEVVGSHGKHELKFVLPEPHSVSTLVYEYGGGAYDVLPPDSQGLCRIIFSDAKDGNAVKLLDVDSGHVTALLKMTGLRYSEFGVSPSGGPWVLAIEEDHGEDGKAEPKDVKNYVVAIHLETGKVERLEQGADFYSTPRFSPAGNKVSWREWEHPEMPWTRSMLCWVEVEVRDDYIGVGVKEHVAGGNLGEGVGESAWGLDGRLYYTQEKECADWRQMFRMGPGPATERGFHSTQEEPVVLKGLEEVEMGDCSMLMGCRSFGFLSPTSMVLTYTKYAANSTVHVNLDTFEWTHLNMPLVELKMDTLSAISPTSFLVIGSGYTEPQGVYRFDLNPNDLENPTMAHVASASDTSFPSNIFSTPEHIELVSKDPKTPKRDIHGFYWPPHNPRFQAPAGTLPPLIVNPHGGPTGHTAPGLKIGGVAGNAQFWTSRGFAYFAINYTGSSGHGKAYRQRLDGQWGILDRDDVPECIDHLCSTGRADREKVGIHGGSAGGYNVLQSLVWHPDVFAGGVCYCGVSDVKQLGEGTHKLESHYLEGLLYEPGMSDEERARVEKERSPVFHAERITAPLLLVHGDEDPVVPIAQSFEIERKVRERGGDVKMIVCEGEGHQFKMTKSTKLALENEVKWWRRTLVGEGMDV